MKYFSRLLLATVLIITPYYEIFAQTVPTFTVQGAANTLSVLGSITGTPVRIIAAGTDSTIGMSIVPKSSGFFALAVPDNTNIGGATRGPQSVDLQLARAAVSQVASGTWSFVAGLSSTASGAISIALGQEVNSSGQASVALNYQTAASGNNALASGNGTVASGLSGTAMGTQSADRGRYSASAFSSGMFSAKGDAQIATQILRISTSAAASVRLTADASTAGTANVINLPNNGAYFIKTVSFIMRDTVTGDAAIWYLATPALIKRAGTASTTALVSAATLTAGPNSGAGCVAGVAIPTLIADTTNGGIILSVTPATANTNLCRAVAEINTVEIQ